MSNSLKLSFKTEAIPVLLVVASFLLGFYFYQHFPSLVATHWNFSGQPDRFSGKFGAAFSIPFIILGVYLLLTILPYIDPRSERYQSFSKVYLLFRNVILLVVLLTFAATGAYNLGFGINIKYTVSILIGLLFIVLGNYMGKVKSNWFVGIRNPWTLSSENVWNKTHRFGGVVMVIFGVLIIISPLLPKALSLTVFILGLILVVVVTNVYSYFLYRKERKSMRQIL